MTDRPTANSRLCIPGNTNAAAGHFQVPVAALSAVAKYRSAPGAISVASGYPLSLALPAEDTPVA